MIGCSAPGPEPGVLFKTRIERPKVDPSLLTCKESPRLPAPLPAETTDADAVQLIAEAIEAGADCRSKVARLRELLLAP